MNAETPGTRDSTVTPSDAARERLLSRRCEPLLLADWRSVVMLHLEVASDDLQPCVPFPLDTFEDRTFVTLVAFTMRHMRPRRGGRIAAWLFRPIATHEFLNVRAYVRVNDEPGIHFMAEWLSNRLAVSLGPPSFGLPYRSAAIRYAHDDTRRVLSGLVEDRRGGTTLAWNATLPDPPEFESCAAGSLEEWLMERYTAFNASGARRRFFRVWHEPWRRCPVEASIIADSLLAVRWPWIRSATLAAASFSPGLRNVWMGWPHRIDPQRSGAG